MEAMLSQSFKKIEQFLAPKSQGKKIKSYTCYTLFEPLVPFGKKTN
jgi:hypothetical protein